VKSKAYIFGAVVVLLAASAAQTSPVYSRMINSARNVQRQYRDLTQGSTPMNAVERLVFSVVLASSNANSTR
jgi:hypothetical protein